MYDTPYSDMYYEFSNRSKFSPVLPKRNLSNARVSVSFHLPRSSSCQIPYEAHNVRLHLIKSSCGVSSVRDRREMGKRDHYLQGSTVFRCPGKKLSIRC
jgi:hypothetical protein